MSTNQRNGLTVKCYRGDAKTLVAFNIPKENSKGLAGFTIQYQPDGQQPQYIYNNLQFKDPSHHAQVSAEPARSSINAPLHKFRWLHVPGSLQQGTTPYYGAYTYTVTPRYFDDNQSLRAIDQSLGVSVKVNVCPFTKEKIELGFTRGFTQSQAFVHHFGLKAAFKPKGKQLIFDTSAVSGTTSAGKFTFQDEYQWLGFTAREKILGVLNSVLADKSLRVDVFAYDLNEPDVIGILLKLAARGHVRIILDNAALHHNTQKPKPEDKFETLFRKAAKKPAPILRGHFGRYAHDKVLIVSNKSGAVRVLTGSTNFSITGLYVNSNHVLIFNDPGVAAAYAKVFEDAWNGKVSLEFNKSQSASKTFSFEAADLQKTNITFSPHNKAFASQVLNEMAKRITQEAKREGGSVLFAVMGLAKGTGPIYPTLRKLHSNAKIFSYGISDTPGGIFLYTPRKKTGVLVTGKPQRTRLPKPFDQVPGVGLGHQVHHKFVVCGFNGSNPVVYCGSSNLALAGEEKNGDNLIAIYDGDIATVFALEALALVDHFDFLDRCATSAKKSKRKVKSASKHEQAAEAGWFLSTTDKWVEPYFDPNDLHSEDRELFG